MGSRITSQQLHLASGSVYAVYLQPTLQIHWNYTAYTLHFGLGMEHQTDAGSTFVLQQVAHV